MCWNQLLLAGLSTGSVYFLTVPSDHTVAAHLMIFVLDIWISAMIISAPKYQRKTWYSNCTNLCGTIAIMAMPCDMHYWICHHFDHLYILGRWPCHLPSCAWAGSVALL